MLFGFAGVQALAKEESPGSVKMWSYGYDSGNSVGHERRYITGRGQGPLSEARLTPQGNIEPKVIVHRFQIQIEIG